MALCFEKQSNGWAAANGTYVIQYVGQRVGQTFELFVNGRREIELFAWLEDRPTTEEDRHKFDEPIADRVAIWKVDASEAVAEQRISLFSIGEIFADFFSAFQFYGGKLSVAGEPRTAIAETKFAPGISWQAWERYGP